MKEKKRRLLVFIILFLVLTVVIGLLLLSSLKDLQDPVSRQIFSEKIATMGFKGVLVFFVVHVIKIIIVVIPGGPLQVIAGAAFGAWGGVLILLAGCAMGTIIVYYIVKKFGQKFIVRFFGIDLVDSWAFLQDKKKVNFATFVLYLIPGFPKDNLSYLISLTKMPLYHFVAISLIARFPAMLSSTIMGDAAMDGEWILFFIIFAITAVVGVLGIQFRDRVIKYFSKSHIPPNEDADKAEAASAEVSAHADAALAEASAHTESNIFSKKIRALD